MKIKSLNTEFDGYNFRSRLEARWAVYFKEMGWDYLYEPQGYILSTGASYLPDFFLPDFQTFIEVKFEVLNDYDLERAIDLVESTQIPLIILDRDPSLKHVTQMRIDEKGEIKPVTVNLVQDPDNKKQLLTSHFLIDKEDYIKLELYEAIAAVKKARSERFGVYD
jgi:hypothetical protein